MTTCTRCDGEGIIGNGDRPWLKQGHLKTCPDCKGKGKIEDEVAGVNKATGTDETATMTVNPKRGIVNSIKEFFTK